MGPFFKHFGLPGEASLAYLTGYFVNNYSAIAVIYTLDMDVRSTTILATMALCSHNMITETLVQHKTGSSFLRILILRTLSAFILGWVLNLIMPTSESAASLAALSPATENPPFLYQLKDWAVEAVKLALTMTLLIFGLSLLQSFLVEYGLTQRIGKYMTPVLAFFGLPADTGFLWIVANTLGLAYGAAVMIEEGKSGRLSRKEIDLLNHHICISHSNLEDIFLYLSVGAMAGWMLFSRWALSLLLVWERRLEIKLKLPRECRRA